MDYVDVFELKRSSFLRNFGFQKQLQVLESSKLKSTIKARKAELHMVKVMREQFEKNERIALRSSKVYQDVHKRKKQQMVLASKMASKGEGEYYVDTDRRIAVGMGEIL